MSRLLTWIGLLGIGFYQCIMRAHFVGGGCRFTPTCSVYAREVLVEQGVKKGIPLIVRRLLQCHPWG